MSPVDTYVSQLDGVLRGARHAKRDLLQEAHDHLVDATDAYETDGTPRIDAERRAVREFGDVRAVAAAYQAVLSASQSRRLGIWMLVAVIAQPFAWDLWAAMPYGHDADNSTSLLVHLNDYIELVGAASLVLAVLSVIGCGIGARYLGVRDWVLRLALTNVLVSAALIVVLSAAMLVAGGEFTVVGVAYTATVAWAPMSALSIASVHALRGVDAVRAPAPPTGAA